MNAAERLRSFYANRQFFVSAGVNNALEARLAAAAGYAAISVSGAGTAAMCGLPDAGLTTLSEVVANATYVVRSVSVPVIVDGENGFGNIHMMRRSVRDIILAGAAGMFIEDQAELRRCGFISGKRVLPVDEAVARYRAAVEVRDRLSPAFVLLARCDARGAAGGSLEDTIARGKAYRQAGMDVLYFEALPSMTEVKACLAECGTPAYFTLAGIPLDERPSHAEMAAMGISNAHYWILRPLRNYPVDRLMWEMLHDVRERGAEAIDEWRKWADAIPWKRSEPPSFHEFMGFKAIQEVEEEYLPAEEQAKHATSAGLYKPGAAADTSRTKIEWR